MKIKLLLSVVLFSFLAVSCTKDATKCVDKMIEQIESAKDISDLPKFDNAGDILDIYDPGYDNEEDYREYFHAVVDEVDARFDEIKAAAKDNKNFSINSVSQEERKELFKRLHEKIDKAEIKATKGKVEITEMGY